MLETYNKEKLHEYAKELFALCLEKKLYFIGFLQNDSIDVDKVGCTYICEELFKYNIGNSMPIWELIEKVKQL